jgi:hypothetical protein
MGKLGYTPEQLATYGETLKSKPGVRGEIERGVYNVGKFVVEQPLNLPVYYLEGRMFGGAAEGIGVRMTAAAEGTGTVATVAKVLTTPGEGGAVGWLARVGYKAALPAWLTVSGAYQVTNQFTDFSKQTVVTNIESGVVPMALMTYGGMDVLSGKNVRAGYDYTTQRFAEKPMVLETYKSEQTLIERPDVQVPSGIGGTMKVAETYTIATQPSIRIAGYDITLPRIFEPRARGGYQTVTEFGQVDVGALTEARLPGTTTEPVVYSRVVETGMKTYRGEWIKSETGPYVYERPGIAKATGTLKTAEVRLPRTFEEYLKMGAEDAKLTGKPQEVITAQLMADAAKVAEPVTGYRELSTSVPAGTPIQEAVDWNVMKTGGKKVEFGVIPEGMEKYFGKMQVTQKGTGVASDYQITVTRDITEEGFLKGGSYDVTGSQVPETKIVRQLQEASRNLKTGYPEEAYAFDNRGNVIYREVGDIGSVSREGVWDAIGKIEGSGSGAHTHNPYITKLSEGIPALKEWWFEQSGKGKFPSQPDMGIYKENAVVFTDANAITADYIVSKKGVSIFRKPSGGWQIWDDIQKTTMTNIDYTPETFEKIKNEGGMQFVGKNQPYKAPGLTERIPDITSEMQGAYPVGVRNQFVDMIDRVILKDPNLEFVREGITIPEKPWHSASTLGKGGAAGIGGGATMGSGRLVSQQVRVPQEFVQVTTQPQIFKTPETIRPSGQTPRPISEPVLAFSQLPSQIIKPASRQSQKIEPRFMIEPVQAFSQPQMQVPQTNPLRENVNVFKLGIVQIPEIATIVTPGQMTWQTPVQSQRQTPLQEQAQIQRQLQITRIQPLPQLTQQIYERPPLPPDIGIPPPPLLPFLPGGAGGGGTKRRGRKFTEYFPWGILAGVQAGYGLKTPKMARPKKGRLIPKEMLSPVKRRKK